MLESISRPDAATQQHDNGPSHESLIAPGVCSISPESDSTTEFEPSMGIIQDMNAASDVPSRRNSISIDALTKVILRGRLIDLNNLIRGEDDLDGLAVPQDLQDLIVRVLSEIEAWLNGGGTMEFKAQITLSNMAYNDPAKDNIRDQFSCKDEKCLLVSYLSILRSATSNSALSDEKRQILLNLLFESEMFVSEPENAMTDKAHQDELNLLHIICDSNVALHSIETAIQALDDGWQAHGSLTELSNEGVKILQNFERFGDVADLERAIAMFRRSVAFTPHNSPDRPGQLINLGNSYLSRFERFGQDKDIDLAIQRQHEGIASTPFNSLDLPGFLNSLGLSYMRRFERFGEVKDIDSAIDQQLKAVVSTPLDSVRRRQRLNSLAISYRRRFQRFGEVKDIDSAIEQQREAVASAPLNSAERAARLSSLGNSYLTHFQWFGEMKHIESAIEQHLEAVASTPVDSPHRSAFLQNLGTSYHSRFERLGEVKDIDLAIQRELEAVASAPPNSDRAGQLNNLGMSYRSRFERLGEVSDINSAIERQHEAVSLTPPNSADRAARLDNLGNSYGSRFKLFGDVKDIDLAIEQQREAVVSAPPDSAHRTLFLNNLGNSHIRRFQEFGDSVKDIESAIERYSEAVASTPPDNAVLPGYLNNLGVAYMCRFEQFGKVEDIDLAINWQRDAVASTPLDSAELAGRLNILGNSYMRRFESTQEVMDCHEALSNFRLSSLSPYGLPSSRMKASLNWTRFTHQLNDLQSASEAYDQAVHLLPLVVWIGLDAVAQLNNLNSKIQSLACDAAACMITLAQADSHKEQYYLGRAIELLDQGRSILWSQTSNFKQDLEGLRKEHPHLADELDLAGKILGQGCFHGSNDTLSESDAQVYRRSAEKWEELVSKIRTLPDFHYFLLPPPISTLRTATVNDSMVQW